MNEFGNILDRKRFESTNSLWNDIMLNDPWSVGYVSFLIESGSLVRKEEWEEFYYESGKTRNRKIAELTPALCHKLNDDNLVLKNSTEIRKLKKETLNLNYYHGRTPEQLTKKAVILFQEAINKSIDITIQECIEAVRFRTICQPWNQFVMRERNIIRMLRGILPGCKFVSFKGDYDTVFAVDYEIFKEGTLMCAIRITTEFYIEKTSCLLTSAETDEGKKLHYSERFGKPVLTVIAKSNGEITNTGVLSELSLLAAVKNDTVCFSSV